MSRSKQYIKDVSVMMWQYLYDHPEIKSKCCLPREIYRKVVQSEHECLLCDEYHDLNHNNPNDCCPRCPLSCCINDETWDGVFDRWFSAKTNRTRKKYAGIILEKIKAWDTTKIIRVKQ
jgi:hypothetical protein